MRLVLLVLVLLVAAAMVAYLIADRRRKRSGGRWLLRERSDGEALVIVAERFGERPMLMERVPLDEPDFESRVEEARAVAAGKVVALNNHRGL